MKAINKLGNSLEIRMKKYFSIFLFFIIVIFFVFFNYEKFFSLSKISLPDKKIEHKNLNTQELSIPSQAESTNQNSEKETAEPLFTVKDSKDLLTWDENHGYYSEQEILPYKGYSDEVLYELAKKGDARALETLGGNLVKRGQSDKAMAYFWEAAAVGSTGVLLRIATLNLEPNYIENETKEMRKELRRNAALESLAVLKTAELRGNMRLKDSAPAMLSFYESNYGPINFTEQETQQIDQRSKEIYNQLQARRTELGLGDFDNSIPKLEKLLLDMKKK